MIKIYYAHIENFDDDFYHKALSAIPREKVETIKKITHIKTAHESILAWFMVSYAYRSVYGSKSDLPKLEFHENGKPSFVSADFYFNISHSDGLVCVAVSENEIGIDVQSFRISFDSVKRRVLSESELEIVNSSENGNDIFIDIWSRKESYLKFTGLGISQELRSLDFSPFLNDSKFVFHNLYYKCMKFENCRLTVCTAMDDELDFVCFELCNQ